MLNFFFSFEFHKWCQSGFYLDFFIKKCSEVFVRNVFIYAAQFTGEKYMIEELTKKIFEKSFWEINKKIGWNKLLYSTFFTQLISIFFYIISILIMI